MNKAVFFDRDGTINEDRHYLYKIEDFIYCEGVIDGLKKLSECGFLLIIITNQSGIARGYYTEDDFRVLNKWMIEDLKKQGISLSGVYYCPHYPEGIIPRYAITCDCRKPKTGLFYRAAVEHAIDLDKSYVVGDKPRDLSIIHETDARGVLLTDSVSNSDRGKVADKNHYYECGSFTGAVNKIIDWENC